MKRYLMIGAPVTTVRTPPLLEAFLSAMGVEARVEARHVEADELDAVMQDVRADRSIDGLLITMPHKRAVIPYLGVISAVAREAGSVNSAKRLSAGDFAGAQFDGVALVNALREKDVPLRTARILLAGVGGAGLPIAQAIVTHGCRSLVISEKNRDLRDVVVRGLCLRDSRALVSGLQIAGDDAAFDLLINATPVGMRDEDPSPFEASLVSRARWVADIVANPPATRLASMARQRGAVVITGRDMVEGQVAPIGHWLMSSEIEQAHGPVTR